MRNRWWKVKGFKKANHKVFDYEVSINDVFMFIKYIGVIYVIFVPKKKKSGP